MKNHNYEKGKNNCVLNNHMLQFFTDSLVDNKEWGRNMISIKELAQRCGVSVATVSKALNDKSDIGEETKKRIRELADEMGYSTIQNLGRIFSIKYSHVDHLKDLR